MKYTYVYALFLMFVFCTSCGGQNKPGPLVTSPGSDEYNIRTKYEYTDSIGKRLIIQNSLPKGGIFFR